MQNIRNFSDYQGDDGYIIVDGIEKEMPGGKRLLSEVAGFMYQEFEDPEIDGDMMIVELKNGRYGYFANYEPLPSNVKTLVIRVLPPENIHKVQRAMFEFTLPDDTELEEVRIVDENDNDCLMMSPMSWSGKVTYQGTVTNKIANIIGYAPVEYNGKWLSTDEGDLLTTSEGKHIAYVTAQG